MEIAIRELCRATTSRPRMRPSDVSALLADLAAATAVFPQVATQLGDILNRAKHDFRLEMDTMAPGEDPARAVETATLHLGATRGPALDLFRLLDAAHNSSSRPRPEDRPPPGPTGPGPYVPR